MYYTKLQMQNVDYIKDTGSGTYGMGYIYCQEGNNFPRWIMETNKLS